MRFSLLLLFAALIAQLTFQPPEARAAETCSCAANYQVYHTGLTWVDFICVFPSTSSGPFNESKRATWKHTFGDRLVSNPSRFFEKWDELLLIEEGKEKEQCETADSDFQKIAKRILQRVCDNDGGTSCSTIKVQCAYKA